MKWLVFAKKVFYVLISVIKCFVDVTCGKKKVYDRVASNKMVCLRNLTFQEILVFPLHYMVVEVSKLRLFFIFDFLSFNNMSWEFYTVQEKKIFVELLSYFHLTKSDDTLLKL